MKAPFDSTNCSDFSSQSMTSTDIFIDYCSIIQNIAEQCGEIFIVDIYLKIFEDNVLNNIYKFFFFFFLTNICKISTNTNKR